MELGKLKIQFIDGFENHVVKDRAALRNRKWPYMMIDYPIIGHYELAKEDEPVRVLRPGEGCFITAPNTRHTQIHRLDPVRGEMVPRWMEFSVTYDDVLDVTGWFDPPFLVGAERAAPFIRAINELVALRGREAERDTVFKKLRIAATVLEELLKISDFKPAALEMERIYPAIGMIKESYGQNITVEQLAQGCAMSASTLHRCFRQSLGMTPMQYLQEYRLKHAARLLTGKQTLAKIAEECGFCDEFHLSRNFKKQFGMSPREYKKRMIL